MRVMVGLAVVLAGVVAAARAQSTGPLNTMSLPRVESSVVVRSALPLWVAMPSSARIMTSGDLKMHPMRSSAVTWENAKVGVLVGALTNVGPCGRNLRTFLQYTDDRWKPMGEPIESEARVSQVEPGAPLPYRFRLKRTEDFAVKPSGYIVQVVEDGKTVGDSLQWVSTKRSVDTTPCGRRTVDIDAVVGRSRSTLRGYRVSGTLTVTAGGPVRPDALTLTALLRDKSGDVLEVLTGVPSLPTRDLADGLIANGQVLPFTLSTDIPLGKSVATTIVFAEVLGDAQTSPDR